MSNVMSTSTLTSVWWDIENCSIPEYFNNYASIVGNIKAALRRANCFGCFGEVSISAYGNLKNVKPIIGDILGRSGVKLYQIFPRNNDSNSSVIPIMNEMLFWAFEHDPPANISLICEDVVDFAGTLNLLSLKRYNIMVAQNYSRLPYLQLTYLQPYT
ncbi:hypothetical protein ABFS83_11G121200 [Erythranthe nasuta]